MRLLFTSLLALALVWVCCASAEAAYGPFELISGSPALHLQAEYAYAPAISANGRYVVFTGSIASRPGVYRVDLAAEPHEVALVAAGTGTGAPSISADGRYVSFTTNDDPVTGAPTASGCSQVYRRDMDQEPAAPGAYTLASGLSGPSEQPLTYGGSSATNETCPGGGSASADRVAISADGNEIAFTVLGESDLSGPCETTPATTKCPTPPDQVAIHDFQATNTTLVSVTHASLGQAPQPVPGGAAIVGPAMTSEIRPIKLRVGASTAAISADGSTVAWMGTDIPEQVPVAKPAEFTVENVAAHEDVTHSYAEPLWRRIADGPASPTRRVLAGDDPSAAGCPPECSGGLNLRWINKPEIEEQNYADKYEHGPGLGSFTERAYLGYGEVNSFVDFLDAITPQLSADGQTVALLSTDPNCDVPEGGVTCPEHFNWGPGGDKTEVPLANAFVVNMAPGLTRAQSITRLTEWGALPFTEGKNSRYTLDGKIESIAISPDGTRVAFVTQRVVFPLAPPTLITPPQSQLKAVAQQLYVANLRAGTLALVSEGYNGELANEPVYSAALSDTGATLALTSAASNLAFGVVSPLGTSGSGLYVTHEIEAPVTTGEQNITPAPPGPATVSGWTISATAGRAPGGALALDVAVPGAGSLSASASASVPATLTVSGRTRSGTTRTRAKHASRSHGKRVPTTRAHKVTAIATRQVARATTATKGVELVRLLLTPTRRYRSLADGRNGLYATITVTFSANGHPPLTQTLQASFPRPYNIYKLPKRKPKRLRIKRGHKRA